MIHLSSLRWNVWFFFYRLHLWKILFFPVRSGEIFKKTSISHSTFMPNTQKNHARDSNLDQTVIVINDFYSLHLSVDSSVSTVKTMEHRPKLNNWHILLFRVTAYNIWTHTKILTLKVCGHNRRLTTIWYRSHQT